MTKLSAQQAQLERALSRLKEALSLPKSDIVRDSAIQRFEFTLDLAWKTVKTYLEDKKGVICASPKECFREAYRQGIMLYDDEWIKLVDLRNETVHTYNEETAQKIYNELPATIRYFEELVEKLK
ncbi:MAG TPA: nucleotidyltransferase [Candidatus Magasanikbacteria bacterium]|uniref:Nucleotidyltransferase substrate binding protein, HI0074 family n=1 Tax=Candidatus Magasanikbacteria bacterium GW2011_GWC2_41_17 TaxID=1619048 RepID=A0A0G0VEK2_9BACT|nr:MAG: Nucleotidyltransferase substrate binding protein, HI0074 family [Candidatus Magasanikbacteria bacterium GW2011_GWC2_41_17]HBV58361.1 nucleotidyltransferase [Candidatus Magasanikbacteria bacterium]HBX16178.1 nucleotidyltransferase [Candidatus Magasanikbacteria bacterium]